MFDFAGQRMYYQMHHIFITPKLSIYLVVFSLEKAPDAALEGVDRECGLTQLDNLHFWLNSVHGRAPSAPIIVVGTHRQSVSDEVAEERLRTIHQSFERAAFKDQLRNGGQVFCVDNAVDDSSRFDELRALILREQEELEDFGRPVPLRWLRWLDLVQSRGDEQMSLRQAREIARGLMIEEQRELPLLLRLFTDVGLVMHFDVDGLRDLIVLQPRWLLNHMRNLLCLRHLDDMAGEAEDGSEKAELLQLKDKVEHSSARTVLCNLRDNGLLEPDAALPELWSDLSAEHRDSMLQYMVHFGLCSRVPGSETEATAWLVPSLLPPAPDHDSLCKLQPQAPKSPHR